MISIETINTEDILVTLHRPLGVNQGTRYNQIKEGQQVRLNTVKSNTFNYGSVVAKRVVGVTNDKESYLEYVVKFRQNAKNFSFESLGKVNYKKVEWWIEMKTCQSSSYTQMR